jgi:hypothetical protein
MAEEEWEWSRPTSLNDVLGFIEHLHVERKRQRKALLAYCALCRSTWDRVTLDCNRRALEASEDYADGWISQQELEERWRSTRFEPVIYCEWNCRAAGPAQELANWNPSSEQDHAALKAFHATFTNEVRTGWWAQEPRFAFDVLDFAFQKVSLSPDWRTDTAVTLARQMSESRDFSAMPILADALQDAGCTSPEILDHCRGPGPHLRGCWVCDLVMEK